MKLNLRERFWLGEIGSRERESHSERQIEFKEATWIHEGKELDSD